MSSVITCNYTFPFEEFATCGAVVGHGERVTLLTSFSENDTSNDSIEVWPFYSNGGEPLWANSVLNISKLDFFE
ncbi:MAG: hypothetical protein KAG61_10400, partial [Bacteriovoracaceae bacterium]|nr:hypothetical protein [Bacteriovoracaceae bacterium]